MRVVHFLHGRANPNGTNGGDRVIYHLARATADKGEEVFILGISEKPPLPAGFVTVRHFAPPHDPFSLPSALKRTLLEIKPDMVHFHGVHTPRNAILGRWLCRRDVPYSISFHGALMPGNLIRKRIRKEAYMRLIGLTFLSRAAMLHAVSEAEAVALRRITADVPVVVAPHGVEGVNISSLDSDYLRHRYANANGRRVLGFLGRLDPLTKGLDLVVEACAQLGPCQKEALVVLAGPDWKDRAAPLRKRVSELGLDATVLFYGPIWGSEKFDFLASCDAFIHPSRWEGLPFSVLDALEVAKPCLVTNATNFGDFIQQHRAGVQVPPTVEGVREGLRYFAEASTKELREMGERGRQAVLREFSWSKTAEKLLRAYKEVGCEDRKPEESRLNSDHLTKVRT